MPIYFGSQLINEARVGTQLYDGYVGSQMVHGKAKLPAFTYDGTYEEHPASYYGLSGDYTVVAFLGSGTLSFSKLAKVDVFAVGAGGGGASGLYAGGGAGGYSKLYRNIEVTSPVTISIGAGGNYNQNGNPSSFGAYTANGGGSGNKYDGGNGGSGGGYGSNFSCGNGGSDGSNGFSNYATGEGGSGQGSTTRAFHESGATLFAGGGAGKSSGSEYAYGGAGGGGGRDHTAGYANTGGGGAAGDSGGSGIVLMRIAQ